MAKIVGCWAGCHGRQGEGGRDLGIMSEVAREAFSLFADDEIADLYHFLRQHHGRETVPGN